jgi:hypothetical protein
MAETGNGSRAAFVDRRKAKNMAQLLEDFEREIEPLIPKDKAHAFKALVRRKFNALSADFVELLELDDRAKKNELAQEIVDQIFADGRLPGRREQLGT